MLNISNFRRIYRYFVIIYWKVWCLIIYLLKCCYFKVNVYWALENSNIIMWPTTKTVFLYFQATGPGLGYVPVPVRCWSSPGPGQDSGLNNKKGDGQNLLADVNGTVIINTNCLALHCWLYMLVIWQRKCWPILYKILFLMIKDYLEKRTFYWHKLTF